MMRPKRWSLKFRSYNSIYIINYNRFFIIDIFLLLFFGIRKRWLLFGCCEWHNIWFNGEEGRFQSMTTDTTKYIKNTCHHQTWRNRFLMSSQIVGMVLPTTASFSAKLLGFGPTNETSVLIIFFFGFRELVFK